MEPTDLIGIGRLGGCDDRGFFQVMVKPRYRSLLLETDELYLIFNSDRVFFVTISDRDICDRKLSLCFAEDGIAEERKLHREVIVAIPAEPAEEDGPDRLLDYQVIYREREIGRIVDFFHNNAQYVLVVQDAAGREIMIPWVDYFVAEIIPDPGVVILSNADSLLEWETDNDEES